MLPDGRTVRERFQLTISHAIKSMAKPSARRQQTEWKQFLEAIYKATKKLSSELRATLLDGNLGYVGLFTELAEIDRNMTKELAEELADTAGKAADAFVSDLVWLLLECGIANTKLRRP